MTQRKITYALNKIKSCKQQGFIMEALIRSYHLNVDLVTYILSSAIENYSSKDKKIKTIIHEFLEELSSNPKLKSIITKKNLKTVKPWLAKMDSFFKSLKLEQPDNIRTLQQDTEKIFSILNISANKLFVLKKA